MRYLLAAVFLAWLAYGLANAKDEPSGPVPFPPVLIVGDSHAALMPSEAGGAASMNYGVKGRTTAQLLAALPSIPFSLARATVLVIGANDVKFGREAGLSARLRLISERIPGELVWAEIPPMVGHDVSQANGVIARLCIERGHCTLVPATFAVSDLQADGTHLNATAQAAWANRIAASLPK